MAVSININGINYLYPESGDTDWGVQATQFAVAVGNGLLQKAGGNFTLLADVNFGPTYGLVSTYFKSRSSDIADTGQLRLARADVIAFRNEANDGNLSLGMNSSNRLTFDSIALTTISSTDTLTNKTIDAASNTLTGIINTSIADAAAIAYSKLALSNSIVNADINASAAIAYSKLALSNSIVNADVNASAAIAGTKINPDFGTQNVSTSGELRLKQGANHVGIKAPDALSSDTVWKLPATDGANGEVLKTDGAGNLDWVAAATVSNNLYSAQSGNFTITDNDNVRTVGMTTSTSNYTVTLPAAANNTDRIITVTKVDSATGTVTANSVTLYSISDSVTVQSDGTNWINIEVALQPRIYVLQASGSGFANGTGTDLAGPITLPAGTYKFDLTGLIGATSASQLSNLSGFVYLTDTSNNQLGNMPAALGGNFSSKVYGSADTFDTRVYNSRSDYFTIGSPTAVKLRAAVGTSGGSSITRYVTGSVIITPITRVLP